MMLEKTIAMMAALVSMANAEQYFEMGFEALQMSAGGRQLADTDPVY